MTIISINVGHRDSEAKARKFIKKYDLKFPVIFDEKSTITMDYMVNGVPTIVIIDTTGTILFRQHYVPDRDEINRLIK